MFTRRFTWLSWMFATLSLLGCSGGNGTPQSSSGGAGPGAGGESPAADGGQTNGSGGSESQGGTPSGGTATNIGGSAVSAGGSSTGGTANTVTSSVTGGAAHSGGSGNPAAGGAATQQGGTTQTGGVTAAGGKATGGSATGGKATGGSAVTGGASTMGGVSTTGGVTNATGGNTNSGACQESKCGSHKWACWKIPTPVSEKLSSPQNYSDLGNGAVRDNVTCLVWEKANPTTKGTWQEQYDRCAALGSSNYAGFSDWRLPTRMEMASITDVTLGSTGYPKIFTVTSGYYATGSFWYKTILTDNDATAGNETNQVWGYGTNGFTSNAILRSPSDPTKPELVARCVRGNGNGEAAGEYAVEPPNHYTVASGEVTDNYTGLVWQQGYSPSLLDHAGAVAYCSTLNLNAHSGWRLPALNELASTVNEAKVGGAIVEAAFPNNPNGCKDPKYWFWAAEASGSNFWGLSYCDGFTGQNVGASGAWNYFPTANARCVRDVS